MAKQIVDNEKYSLVCDKGNMVLNSYIYKDNLKKAYNLSFNIENFDITKINFENLLNYNIYNLLEKINGDLIEKIHILKIYNDDAADILIILKNIGKEIGLKQKYIIFYTKRKIDFDTNVISFSNQDINLMDPDLVLHYLTQLKIDKNKYEQLLYNYGIIEIKIINQDLLNIFKKNINNDNKIITLQFNNNFQIITNDDLPIYMENLIGLMIKKIFYNLKQYIDNLK